MKKLIVYTLFFWVLLPLTSQAMFRKTFNINNSFSKTNKFFNNQNFHTSTPQNARLDRWQKKSNKPSIETKNQKKLSAEAYKQFEQVEDQFRKISSYNLVHNMDSYWSEYKVSFDDSNVILKTINNIKSEDINSTRGLFSDTFLNTCIVKTSHFPDTDAAKIINKILEKGAKIDNPQAIYFPLWLAVLQGNSGAYNALIDLSPETHLSERYKDKILKLPHVVGFGLNRLKTMEGHYLSEVQKVKNGERNGYFYIDWLNRVKPYHKAVADNLQCATWFKNKFQKIQNYTTHHFSKNKPGFVLPEVFENESLINSFLEERVFAFREHKDLKIYNNEPTNSDQ